MNYIIWKIFPRFCVIFCIFFLVYDLVHASEYSPFFSGFEQNTGQYSSRARYIGKGKGWLVAIYRRGLAIRWKSGSDHHDLNIDFSGHDHNGDVKADSRIHSKINYFLDDRPEKWLTDIPVFSRVKQVNIYPGIDVVYYFSGNSLEFDFKLQPYADPSHIRMSFSGDYIPRISSNGTLISCDRKNFPSFAVPLVYQTIDGVRRTISATYHKNIDGSIGLVVSNYDKSKELIIDPIIEFSSYIGGSGTDDGHNAVIKNGFLYIAGTTTSPNFPVLHPYQAQVGSIRSSYVAKFDISGASAQLVYSTYIGNDVAELRGMVVDDHGNVYITGSTSSTTFPLVNPVQSTNAGIIDGYIVKLNPAGDAILYSTYFGGNSVDRARAMTIDNTGAIYVTGATASTDFSVVNAWQSTNAGGVDAYLLKLKPDGSAFDYFTYIGGASLDYGAGIALDNNGGVLITGNTGSADFPTINPLQSANAGGYDAFVVDFDASGIPVYSDFLGGSGDDFGMDIGIDSSDRIIIYGQTASSDFPLTIQSAYSGGDAFLTSIDRKNAKYHFSRYLGGSGSESAWRMTIDANDVAHVVGDTTSTDFPLALSTQSSSGGGVDGFVSSLSLKDGSLLFSSYIGGSLTDRARGVSKVNGNLLITGTTASSDFPLQQPYQASNGGDYDSFVVLINIDIDADNVDDYFDNCPTVYNPNQVDTNQDGVGNACDYNDNDSDNDGLIDSFEISIGTDPYKADTDGDTLSDYYEVAYDGNASSYNPSTDLNPLSADTDGDGLNDNVDPIPLTYNYSDGDLAPLGSPDSIINAADLLIAKRLAGGNLKPTALELSHGDLYPPGAPDGVIDIQDLIMQLKLLQLQ